MISLPEDISSDDRSALAVAAQVAVPEVAADIAAAYAREQGAGQPPPAHPLSGAVSAVMAHAANLERLHKSPRNIVSTSLLFFSLADSQAASAPSALRDERAAEVFAGAVLYLAQCRYSQAWLDYFGTDAVTSAPPASLSPGTPPPNVARILEQAGALVGAGTAPIEIDHLVTALLGHTACPLGGNQSPRPRRASPNLLGTVTFARSVETEW